MRPTTYDTTLDLLRLAKELGIERPKLRNQRAITNQNTLIYVLLNLRLLQRIQARAREETPVTGGPTRTHVILAA